MGIVNKIIEQQSGLNQENKNENGQFQLQSQSLLDLLNNSIASQQQSVYPQTIKPIKEGAIQKYLERVKNRAVTAAEIAAMVGTSALAEPVAGIGGLLEIGQHHIRHGNFQDALVAGGETVRKVRDRRTYQPKAEPTLKALEKITPALEATAEVINDAAVWVETNLGIPREVSKGLGQGLLELMPPAIALKFASRLTKSADDVPKRFYQSGMMSGVKAKNADMDALKVAKSMHKEMEAALKKNKIKPRGFDSRISDAEIKRSHRNDIWAATGWGLFPDGKWKFEIDDSDMRLKRLPKGGQQNLMLKENLVHPELFANYPELDDVALLRMGKGESDYLLPGEGSTTNLTPKGMNPPGHQLEDAVIEISGVGTGALMKEVTAHESQHAIQFLEGFGGGGDADPTVILQGAGLLKRVKMNADLMRRQGEDPKQIARRLRMQTRKLYSFVPGLKQFEAIQKDLPSVREMRNTKGKRQDEIDGDIDRANADREDLAELVGWQAYSRLLGEIEANTTSKRLKMTPEERRSRSPFEDMFHAGSEVGEEQVIIRFADLSLGAQNIQKKLIKPKADKAPSFNEQVKKAREIRSVKSLKQPSQELKTGLLDDALPWRTGGKEGDLYITRVGTNAGTVSKTRTSANDIAINLDHNQLLPDYAYYLLMSLKPKINARAHGTVQQAIKKSDIDDVLMEYFMKGQ